MRGRNCDNCDYHLEEDDFESFHTWSYTCPECGFTYIHSSELTIDEQIDKFLYEDSEDSPAT